MSKKYTQLTEAERYHICTMKKQGYSNTKISRGMARTVCLGPGYVSAVLSGLFLHCSWIDANKPVFAPQCHVRRRLNRRISRRIYTLRIYTLRIGGYFIFLPVHLENQVEVVITYVPECQERDLSPIIQSTPVEGENTTTVVNCCLVSPETANAVLVEKRLNRDKNKVACKRLGDKHSIERIAVGTRQLTGASGVVYGNRQFFKALAGNCPGNVQRDNLSVSEFTETVLGCDFPSRGCAHQHIVRFICNRLAGLLRQPFASGEPPQKCVGVQ